MAGVTSTSGPYGYGPRRPWPRSPRRACGSSARPPGSTARAAAPTPATGLSRATTRIWCPSAGTSAVMSSAGRRRRGRGRSRRQTTQVGAVLCPPASPRGTVRPAGSATWRAPWDGSCAWRRSVWGIRPGCWPVPGQNPDRTAYNAGERGLTTATHGPARALALAGPCAVRGDRPPAGAVARRRADGGVVHAGHAVAVHRGRALAAVHQPDPAGRADVHRVLGAAGRRRDRERRTRRRARPPDGTWPWSAPGGSSPTRAATASTVSSTPATQRPVTSGVPGIDIGGVPSALRGSRLLGLRQEADELFDTSVHLSVSDLGTPGSGRSAVIGWHDSLELWNTGRVTAGTDLVFHAGNASLATAPGDPAWGPGLRASATVRLAPARLAAVAGARRRPHGRVPRCGSTASTARQPRRRPCSPAAARSCTCGRTRAGPSWSTAPPAPRGGRPPPARRGHGVGRGPAVRPDPLRVGAGPLGRRVRRGPVRGAVVGRHGNGGARRPAHRGGRRAVRRLGRPGVRLPGTAAAPPDARPCGRPTPATLPSGDRWWPTASSTWRRSDAGRLRPG